MYTPIPDPGRRAIVFAAAAASLVALVVIGFHLPNAIGRVPAPASATPEDESADETTTLPRFTVEDQDLACPDLNGMDGVPQLEDEPYDIGSDVQGGDDYTWYVCRGELENLSELYFEGEPTAPTVIYSLRVEVYDDAGRIAVAAERAMDSDYFAGWDHASHNSEVNEGYFRESSPVIWLDYELRAMDSNLALALEISYLYFDESFDAAAASQALAETLTESVVSQIPRP